MDEQRKSSFFYPEDGGSIFLQNLDKFTQDYMKQWTG